MTITLNLSSEQERRLRAGTAQHDVQTVRNVLLEAVEATVEGLLQVPAQPKPGQLSALLEKVAAEFHDAPPLSNEAVSRAGIYADHP